MRLKILLLILTLAVSGTSVARPEIFEGSLVSDTPLRDRPIPILLELETLHGIWLGTLKTGHPLRAYATVSGTKNSASCHLEAHALETGTKEDLSLGLTGSCTPTTFEGRYTLYQDGKEHRKGTFKLKGLHREETPETDKPVRQKSAERPVSAAALSACSTSNTSCLAGCPLMAPNEKIPCARRCMTELATCQAKAANP